MVTVGDGGGRSASRATAVAAPIITNVRPIDAGDELFWEAPAKAAAGGLNRTASPWEDDVAAPAKAKAKAAKAKPKGLFRCETSPVNESAMQKLRPSIANTLTFTTNRRSTDLTFAVASG